MHAFKQKQLSSISKILPKVVQCLGSQIILYQSHCKLAVWVFKLKAICLCSQLEAHLSTRLIGAVLRSPWEVKQFLVQDMSEVVPAAPQQQHCVCLMSWGFCWPIYPLAAWRDRNCWEHTRFSSFFVEEQVFLIVIHFCYSLKPHVSFTWSIH